MEGPSDGWYRLGEVALTVPDLGSALTELRSQVVTDDAEGPEVKLILPDEQVKFMTVPAQTGDADLTAAIEQALDGATPYPVADLAYDYAVAGDSLHIAAVTRQTLAEAEGFAIEHDFLPLSFVTIPPKGDMFPREPFFGATQKALTSLTPGVTVTGDDLPVAVLGDAPEAPVAAPEPDPQPEAKQAEPEATPEPQTVHASESKPDKTPDEKKQAKAKAPDDAPAAEKPAKAKPAPAASKEKPADAAPRKDAAQAKAASDPESAKKPAKKKTPPADDSAPKKAPKPDVAKKDATAKKKSAAAKPLPSPADVPPAVKPVPGAGEEAPPAASPGFASIRAKRDTAPGAARTPLSADKTVGNTAPIPKPERDESLTDKDALATQEKAKASLTERPKADTAEAAAPVQDAGDDVSTGQRAASFATAAMARASTGLGKGIGFVSRRTARKPEDTGAKPGTQERTPPAGGKQRVSLRGKGAAAAIASGNMMEESERMTVFGARGKAKVGGKPRFLGLILTSILLLFLLAVAAWASLFLEGGVASLFGRSQTPVVASVTPEIRESEITTPAQTPVVGEDIPEPALKLPVPETDRGEEVNLASLSEGVPVLSEELVEEQIDGLSVPFEAEALTPEQAEARYAATGIWQRAPAPPAEPQQGVLADLYVASIDPGVSQGDAIAIPSLLENLTDRPLSGQRNPLPFDSGLTFDDNGLIEPSPEGVVTPDGYRLILGSPAIKPPARPGQAVDTTPDEDAQSGATEQPAVVDDTLAGFRPRPRPGNLVEQNERANLGGLSLSEFAQKRPRLRPPLSEEKLAGEADETATEFAVASSLKPNQRPRNFASLVDRARKNAENEVVRTAAVAPRTVQPKIPSSTNVAKQATVRNAINLRKVNLIGVYGKPSARRALVRLSNGRYKKVKVGDRIDGGRVAAIGEDRLSYTKSGRQVVLQMPKG